MPDQIPEPSAPYTVVELKVDGFKRLRAAHVRPSAAGLVQVRGRNRQGKTSLLSSILEALGAKKSDRPIHDGDHAGEILATLDNGNPDETLVVRAHFTKDAAGAEKRGVAVTYPDGRKLKRPATVLKAWRSHFADPVAFIDAKPEDQVRTVLAILGLDGRLRELEEEAEGIYEQRRDLGRESDRLGKAAVEAEEEVSMLPAPGPEGRLQGALSELQEMNDRNAAREAHAATVKDAEARGRELAARAERLRSELATAEAEIESQRARWSVAATAKLEAGDHENTTELADEIGALERAAEDKGRRELAGSLRHQADEAKAAHELAERRLETKREEIRQLFAKVEFPFEGMHYDPEGRQLLIGVIPFAQASQSEQIMTAAAVAMAGAPSIKVILATEGSLLDGEAQAQLAELCEARGFQLWLEVVDSEREGEGIFIEDGEAFEGGAS